MLCSRDVFVFDVDNTLAQNWGIYDEAYRRTSRQLLGREFSMTTNLDGSPDRAFTRITNPQLLANRLSQLDISPSSVDVKEFFAVFDQHAVQAALDIPTTFYHDVEDFLAGLHGARLVLLSGGTRQLQLTALKPILHYFELEESLFLEDFKEKSEAMERIVKRAGRVRNFVCIGDAPSDMHACLTARVSVEMKLGLGVLFSGQVTKAQLLSAGACRILYDYSPKSLRDLKSTLIHWEAS